MALESGQMLQNRYEIKEYIGEGGFSTVYRADDRILRCDVAIKEFNRKSAVRFGDVDEMQRRFEQEARITRKLRHRHIIDIYDLFHANDTCYIVMPYLPDTLDDRLNGMSIPEAIRVMSQVCKGLSHAHTFRREKDFPAVVVHCDIKPGNILFEENQVRITDFGIAHVPKAADMTDPLTTTAFGAGTPFYMPPEQLDGKRDIPQIDVYALGALFFRMLTQGSHYYIEFDLSGTTEARAKNIASVYREDPLMAPVEDLPRPLKGVILKALSKNPGDRYVDAGEMLKAIERYEAEVSSPHKSGVLPFTETTPLPLEEATVLLREFRQARNPEEKKAIVEEMVRLYIEAPANVELKAITREAATNLGELTYRSSSDGETTLEVIRLLYPLVDPDSSRGENR